MSIKQNKPRSVPPGFDDQLNNIAIDFDGVIHNFDKGWNDGTCYGEPIPGSIEAIKNYLNIIRLLFSLRKLSLIDP